MERKYLIRRAVFALVVAVVGAYVGIILGAKQYRLEKVCTATTTGTVTELSTSENDDEITYYSTVEFEIDGKKYKQETSNSNEVTKGQEVTVFYDPDDHDSYYIKGVSNKSFMMIVVGGVFLVAGLGMLIKNVFRLLANR